DHYAPRAPASGAHHQNGEHARYSVVGDFEPVGTSGGPEPGVPDTPYGMCRRTGGTFFCHGISCLMSCRGISSLTLVFGSAQIIDSGVCATPNRGRTCVIL